MTTTTRVSVTVCIIVIPGLIWEWMHIHVAFKNPKAVKERLKAMLSFNGIAGYHSRDHMHGYNSFRPAYKNTIIFVGSWSQEDNAACRDIVKELLQCITAAVIMLCSPSQFYNYCIIHTVDYKVYRHTRRCVRVVVIYLLQAQVR